MWYQIDKIPNWDGHVVYKIIYCDKYVIVAGKTIQRSIENINVGLLYFIKNTPKGRNQNDRYYKFYSHVLDNPFNEFSFELLIKTTNPFEYLKVEFLSLQASQKDENCLNTLFDVYIPQHTQVNGKRSWINRGFYLNFMNWKKGYYVKLSANREKEKNI